MRPAQCLAEDRGWHDHRQADRGCARQAGLQNVAPRESVPAFFCHDLSSQSDARGVELGLDGQLGCQQTLLLILSPMRALDDVSHELRAERQRSV